MLDVFGRKFMNQQPAKKRSYFHIGMRNFKTALAATLCALVYFPFHRNPTFACIGAIFGMGNDMGHSWLNGGNRLFGTVIGGFLGMGLFRLYICFYPDGSQHLLMFLIRLVSLLMMVFMKEVVWVLMELVVNLRTFLVQDL